jgi:hypothetical protein
VGPKKKTIVGLLVFNPLCDRQALPATQREDRRRDSTVSEPHSSMIAMRGGGVLDPNQTTAKNLVGL